MMDRKTVIESGMLEQYFLGTLPEEQMTMLEKMLAEDAELAQKFSEIEEDLERIAFENKVSPPDYVKQNIMNAIRGNSKVRVLTTKTSGTATFLWIAAATAFLFMISTLWLFTQWNTAQDELQLTQQELQSTKQQMNNLEGNLKDSEVLAAVVKDPNTKQYVLVGNDKIPGGLATAYINHENKSAIVNAKKLPKLSEDKTYQMWADVDGEMINMGLIDASESIVLMEYIADASSLNITIEPAGGSEHATVSQLVTNVYL